MEKLISCCGLNCETCDARVATVQNSNELRKETAAKWQEMFNVPELPFETINCTGCRMEGVKFSHCTICQIRNCVKEKGYETCGDCAEMKICDLVGAVHKFAPEAIANLTRLN